MTQDFSDELRQRMQRRADGVVTPDGAVSDVRQRARRQETLRRTSGVVAAVAVVVLAVPVVGSLLPSEDRVVVEESPAGPGPGGDADAADTGSEDAEPDEAEGGDAGDAGPASDPSPPPAREDPAPQLQPCRDPSAGFALAYPSSWETTELVDGTPCRLFDPEPIEIGEHANDDVEVAIVVDVLVQSFDELVEGQAAAGSEVDRRRIDGRRAARIVGEADGEALLPSGTGVVTWVVELGEGAVTLSTTDHPDDGEAFDEHVEVVDAMARSVRPVDGADGG